MNKRVLWLAVILAIPVADAQTTTPLSFEVASVREAPNGPNGVRGGCHGIDSVYNNQRQRADAPPLGYCVITDARLSHLIGIAYGVEMANLKTGPDWIQRGDLRFNVQAKAENPDKATEQQLVIMLQNMLIDRFQLKSHYETRDAPGFTLNIAQKGSKLKASQADEPSVSFTGPNHIPMAKPVPGQPISMTVRKYSMPMLANILTFVSTGPVLDKTGITGEYDFTLAWDEENGPALSTALREQLGLSLEATKVPVSTFVVDSAQKPSEN
jgi:uncharacterized protein (TIGR03435 family)